MAAGLLLPAPALAQVVSFSKSVLSGAALSNPTALQFGPDGRLYVTQQNGTIQAFTVMRTGPNAYAVAATETITIVRDVPNRNDNGALNPGVTGREVTGVLIVGTAANPVIYVASSDPRIGAGSSGTDSNLDTNSGILHRLTWTGSSWAMLDLVRGLPRSEENHASNGLVLDAATNTLYIAQGGHTNMGAPSNNFALLPEYALSAAILSVDLDAIGATTYDLPTLDDPSAARNTGTPGVDLNDPFGGNDGANQARLVPGGPVQVHSPGFRNPYDLVVNGAGRMYTIDNGPNGGWGDTPVNEGPAGNCTNGTREPGDTDPDNLHYVTGPGFYGGHPNPTRASTANTFNGQSPVTSGNAVECDYRTPGAQDGALATFGSSTNGLAEYTASNFGGALTGDLLAASFDNTIYRIELDASGTSATVSALFSSVGATPLDVVAQGDAGPFAGSVWVADYAVSDIVVYEPADFSSCSGADNPALDEDGDQYDNADEIDNGTNPCSPGDVPPDWDGDYTSNLNDPDDDNDGRPDTSDPFAIDPGNGAATALPVLLTWDNDAPRPGGLLNLGFTGLMTAGAADYESLYDPAGMTAGGAAGVCTVDAVAEGDAFSTTNTQEYAFQLGVNVSAAAGPFTAHTRILAPFAGLAPSDFQSMGLFLGTGTQDDYVKLVVSANGGAGGVLFLKEVAGSPASRPQPLVPMPGPDAVDLFLTVDPLAGTVQPAWSVITSQVPGPVQDLGGPEPIPAAWLSGPDGLAVGIIATSSGPGAPFAVTWDFLKIRPGAAVECVNDTGCDDGNPCTDDLCFANACLRTNNTNPCDDALACTTGDVCTGGTCGGGDACAPGLECAPATGACEFIDADLDNDGLVGAADPCPVAPRNLCYGPVAVDGASGAAIRLNAGVTGSECGGAKVDCAGTAWNADFGYNQSVSSSTCNLGGGGEGCVIGGIAALFGCEDETTEDLFQCEHWDSSAAPELAYSFAVPNGTYLVNLFFANTYTGTVAPGTRLFDIVVEGTTAYAGFDAVAAAGGSGQAVVRSVVAGVLDGTLDILFGHGVENPAIKAIEVLRQDRDGDGVSPPADCDDADPRRHPGAAELCDALDNDCDGNTDEGFELGQICAAGVGACQAIGVLVCNATGTGSVCNAVPGQPLAEVCDDLDNDCDGTVDNAAPPAAIGVVDVGHGPGAAAALAWGVLAGASGYDLLRGDPAMLRATGGDFTAAVTTCLLDDAAVTTFGDPTAPAEGGGFLYLVRGMNCGGGGSWESGGAGQAAPRDPEITLSAAACP